MTTLPIEMEDINDMLDELRNHILEETPSKAGFAVIDTCAEALKIALEEHDKKRDIWVETLDPFASAQIVMHKAARVKELLYKWRSLDVKFGDIIDEINEELRDCIVYTSFAHYLVNNVGPAAE